MSYLKIAREALKNKVLERNRLCNSTATDPPKPCNFEGQKEGLKVASGKAVENLSLEEFKERKLAIRIKSEVLNGEEFYLVSNDEIRDRLKREGFVSYLPDEISALREKSHEMIRKIHETKKIFLGSKVIG